MNDPLDVDGRATRLTARRRPQQPLDDGNRCREYVRVRRREDRLQCQNNRAIIIVRVGCVAVLIVMMQSSAVTSGIGRMVRVGVVRRPVPVNHQRSLAIVSGRGVHVRDRRQRQGRKTERNKQRNGSAGRHRA